MLNHVIMAIDKPGPIFYGEREHTRGRGKRKFLENIQRTGKINTGSLSLPTNEC